MLKLSLNLLALLAVSTSIASAQVTQELGPGPAGAPAVGAFSPKAMVSIGGDFGDMTPVKGAPFCATVTTEHTQPFADGNRIHTTESSTLCRDSEGRTRREARLNLLGAAAQQQPATKMITIVDPAAGYRYILDANDKTVRRMPLPSLNAAGERGLRHSGGSTKRDNVMFFRTGGGDPGGDVVFGNVFVNHEGGPDGKAPATENLGDQMIEGVHATGTRVTTTIPAGKMGNEMPILVKSERWYSPELKATVMTKHNDPWAGELKTQFTNVNTAEPDAALFAVPSDYKLVDEKSGPFVIKLPPPAPPQE